MGGNLHPRGKLAPIPPPVFVRLSRSASPTCSPPPRATPSDHPSNDDSNDSNVNLNPDLKVSLPPGLSLSPEGELLDEAGKRLNEFGATRFDVAVRAMRGEMTKHLDHSDDPDSEDNATGRIASSLLLFPCRYTFTFVSTALEIRSEDETEEKRETEWTDTTVGAFVASLVEVIERRAQQTVPEEWVVTKIRMGKFVRCQVEVVVKDAETIAGIFEETRGLTTVKMAY